MDASIPSDHFPEASRTDQNTGKRLAFSDKLERAAFKLGLTHLFGACPGSFPGYRFDLTLPRLEAVCREHFETYTGERDNFDRSGLQAARTHSYGDMPILILSRETTDKAWNQKQESLEMLSEHSRRVIAKGSGHYVQVDRPELVEEQMRLFIQQIRDQNPELNVDRSAQAQ